MLRVAQRIGGLRYVPNVAAMGRGNGLLNNLIAYYKLDEAAGANDAVDAHTGGLTLTQASSPASAAGILGTARVFNATVYFARAGDDAELSTGDVDFTLSVWVYLAAVNVNQAIVTRYQMNGNQREYLLYWNYNDHAPNSRFSFTVSSNGAVTTTLDATTFGAASINTWYHVVAWHDSVNNLLGIAINGVSDTAAYSSGVFNSTAAFTLGGLWNNTTFIYPFNGRIDEVGFWKSAAGNGGALTAVQRAALYNGGAGLAYSQLTP